MNDIVRTLRTAVKKRAPLLVRPLGVKLLTKVQTEIWLQPSQIAYSQSEIITLPSVPNFTDKSANVFTKTIVPSAETHVWSCQNPNQKISQWRNGSVVDSGKVLDTDFGTSAVFSNLFKLTKRDVFEADTLLAPWSHYWGGYHDYLFFIAAKLCRFKDVLPAEVFNKAVVAYPLLNTGFEQDVLDRIGIQAEKRLDSRATAVRFDRCLLGSNNDHSWFYPNQTDLLSLKKHILTSIPEPVGEQKRLYISRSGRRRVLNEDKLIQRLESYDFSIVDDKPRTLAEQIALYNNASVIVGPHGASFANILWCQPGTHLVELFAPDYVPDYFRFLSQVLGLHYSAGCNGLVTADSNSHQHVNSDMTIDVDSLERQLVRTLETNDMQAQETDENRK